MDEKQLLQGRFRDLSDRAFRQGYMTHTAFLSASEQAVFYDYVRVREGHPDSPRLGGAAYLLYGGREDADRRAAVFLPAWMDREGFAQTEAADPQVVACLRITPEGIHALEKACMDFEEAAKSDDVSLNDLAEKDIAFHDVIYNATGNTRLISILSNMWEQMYRYRLEYLKSGAQHAKLIEEHRKILETVSAGNADMAEKVITEHVTEQERCVMEKIRSESGEENGK